MSCDGCVLKYHCVGCAVKVAIENAITKEDPGVAIEYVRLTYGDVCSEVEKLIKEAGGSD